jgi:hypothetical protein
MADIAQPHDRFFKALMASPGAANALFRERLPRRLVQELADAPPEPVGAELIDARLQSSSADGLYRLWLRGRRPLFVYSLVEHKSAPEPDSALQLLGHMVRIWVGEKPRSGAGKKLPKAAREANGQPRAPSPAELPLFAKAKTRPLAPCRRPMQREGARRTAHCQGRGGDCWADNEREECRRNPGAPVELIEQLAERGEGELAGEILAFAPARHPARAASSGAGAPRGPEIQARASFFEGERWGPRLCQVR